MFTKIFYSNPKITQKQHTIPIVCCMNKVSPVMKWPGGKRRLLKELNKYVPQNYDQYYEPFFGGGALYFNQQPKKATISDINPELINLYIVIKNKPQELIAELQNGLYINDKENFLHIRNLDRDKNFSKKSDVQKAARTLYLNKTCFNGLYRVNSSHQFNTPYGKYENPKILDAPNILNISNLFTQNETNIINEPFITVLKNIDKEKNFVYLDPPYIPLTITSSFTSYTGEGFRDKDHIMLAEMMKELDEKGNYVLLSNSDTPVTREIYSHFNYTEIQVTRSISANSTSRKQVGELLIVGKTLQKHLNKI